MLDAFRIHSAKELCTEMLLELVSSIGICILNHPSTALQQFPMIVLLKLYYQYILFLLKLCCKEKTLQYPRKKSVDLAVGEKTASVILLYCKL